MEGSWSPEELERCHINELELAASTFGLVALAKEAGFSDVYSWTDNTSAMAWMRGSSTPTTVAAQCMCSARVEWMLGNCVSESAERITSEANLWADQGSRGDIQLVVQQARAFGLHTRRVNIPEGWRDLLLQ